MRAPTAVPETRWALFGHVLVSVLFDPADPERVAALEAWEPEVVRGGDGVLYLSYERVQGSKLTTALIEKRLGVGTTARTPATLTKMLADGTPNLDRRGTQTAKRYRTVNVLPPSVET